MEADITIVVERGRGGISTNARVIPNNQQATEKLDALIVVAPGKKYATVQADVAEEVAQALRKEGLTVEIK